jgi:antitoxin VapB
MALQIANPVVVDKVERLAKATGLSKTAAVEKAVDRLLLETGAPKSDAGRRMSALVAQFDRIPDRPDAFDPMQWDDQGLPR